MTLRAGHGNGRGTPRIEVLPIDELPAGLPGPYSKDSAMPRPPYAKGSPEAKECARRGGRSKAGTTRLASELGLTKAFGDPSFEKYRSAAVAFAKLQTRELAQTVGGGRCGPAASSIVMSAALQLAASRMAFEVLNDPIAGSRLANDSRQNLLAAWELAAKDAQVRGKRHVNPMHAAILNAGNDSEVK